MQEGASHLCLEGSLALSGKPVYSSNQEGKHRSCRPTWVAWLCCAKHQGPFGDEERLFCLSADRQVYQGRYIFSCSFDTCWRPLLLCAGCLKHLLSARCCVRAGPALKKQLFVFVYGTFLWTYHILKKIKEKNLKAAKHIYLSVSD